MDFRWDLCKYQETAKLLFTCSRSYTRVCPWSIIVSIIYKWSAKLVVLIFKFILFADDSTLSTSFAEENALEFTLTLNHELNNVNNWQTSNRICINAHKTKYIIFSYGKLLHLINIKIGSATIEEINNIKFLGIIFDKHLTFKYHVDVHDS